MNADLAKDRLYLPRAYLAAVRRAGGTPLILPPVAGRRDVKQQLDGIAALLLTGADDYRPSLYGKRMHPKVKLVLREKEEHDMALCAAALERDLPILAVCGGLQLLSIVAGGSLAVHVEGHAGGHHGISIDAGSRLRRILRCDRLRVNTRHHQLVEKPGRGLHAVAHARDGSIEALEGRGSRFLLAVQWHPEKMQTKASARLFAALIHAVKR
jgi:putative glutamine amidotransferase